MITLKNFFIFLVSTHLCHAASHNFYILPNHDAGFFSNYLMVIGFLNFYETHPCAGIKVDFGNSGLYYDISHGSNWWEYYFEPIYLGNHNEANIKIMQNEKGDFATDPVFRMHRDHSYYLIQKYIKVKPHIMNKVNNFIHQHFNNRFVIGIHYRATDHSPEFLPPSHETMLSLINSIVQQIPKDLLYTIFIATDEQKFLDLMQQNFNHVISADHYRCNDNRGIHLSEEFDNYIKGEEALIDAILLSNSSLLIKTNSNLSFSSAVMNNNLPIYEIVTSPQHIQFPNNGFNLRNLPNLLNIFKKTLKQNESSNKKLHKSSRK